MVTETKKNSPSYLWLVPALIVLILIQIFARHSKSENTQEKANYQFAEDYQSALAATKSACQQFPEKATERARSKVSLENRAVEAWKKLAFQPNSHAGAWRRLGIVSMLFKRPEGFTYFEKTASAPDVPQLVNGTRTTTALTPPDPFEPEFWRRIYKSNKISALDAELLLIQLKRYNLGWLERPVRIQIYLKAGNTSLAYQEQKSLYSSAAEMSQMSMIQIGAFLSGIVLIFLFVFKSLFAFARSAEKKPSSPQLTPATTQLSSPIRIQTFIVYLVLMTGIGLLALSLLSCFPQLKLITLFRLSLLLQAACYFLIVFLTFTLLRHGLQNDGTAIQSDWKARLLGWRFDHLGTFVMLGIRYYCITSPFFLILALLSSQLFSRFYTPPNPITTELLLLKNGYDIALVFLITSIGAPLVEELLFRGVLYPALREKLGILGGAALSAAIFAIIHPNMPSGFLPLWCLGFAFALVYQKTGSLLPNMVMHAVHNTLAVWTILTILSP